jgi:hypothetical protein
MFPKRRHFLFTRRGTTQKKIIFDVYVLSELRTCIDVSTPYASMFCDCVIFFVTFHVRSKMQYVFQVICVFVKAYSGKNTKLATF